jgi:hypothetical protein
LLTEDAVDGMVFSLRILFPASAQQSTDGAHRWGGVLVADPFLQRNILFKIYMSNIKLKKSTRQSAKQYCCLATLANQKNKKQKPRKQRYEKLKYKKYIDNKT